MFITAWFTRSWVVQEFVLARKVIVLCGNTTFDWADIEAISDFLATRVSPGKLRSWVGEDFDIDKAAFKSPAKLEAVKRDLQARNSSTLLRSLIRCREYACKEDKDKIFSLLGIYQVGTQIQLCPEDRLFPDYGLDTAKVFTNAAVQILGRDEDLTVLTVAEGDDFRNPERIPNLPSWVPDWTFSTWRTSIGLGITGYKRYNAATTLRREIAFSDNDAVLSVKAARLDDIIRIGETKEEVHNGGNIYQWLQIAGSAEFRSRYHSPESRRDAFWRTLVTDTDEWGHSPARPSLEAGFLEWIASLVHFDENVRKRVKEYFVFDDEIRQSKIPAQTRGHMAAEYELQYAHALHQRPFLTSKGYLGLGTRSMKMEIGETGAHDYSIWLVCGARIPLIFRKTARAGYYMLVGGAYVHGLMQGEALRRDLDFETIKLM